MEKEDVAHDEHSLKAPARIRRRGGTPLVSIFVAGCNVEAYVEEAIESLLRQTLDDFDLLVLDDGSEDKTFDVIMGMSDPRIKAFRNETNKGIAFSLNRLMDLAEGEFLAHMDADDISLPDRLERQVALLSAEKNVWVCSSHFEMFGAINRRQFLPLAHDEIKASLLFFSSLCHGFATYRGDAFRRHGIRYALKMPCALDYELWCRIAVQYPEARFANVDAVLGLYRRYERQISTHRVQEQKHMATRAQMQVFQALGFKITNPDLKLHAHLYHGQPVKQPEELARLFEWALCLQSANGAKGLFDPVIFHLLLTHRLRGAVESAPHLAGMGARLLAVWLEKTKEEI